MRRSIKSRPVPCLGIVGIVVLATVLIYGCLEAVFFVFVGPTPTEVLVNTVRTQQLKKKLATAKALWELRGITEYQITTTNDGYTPANYLSCRPADTLTVKNDEVVAASRLAECHEIYQQLTVEKMFGEVERELNSIDPTTVQQVVTFDPDYGYISGVSITQFARGGVFGNTAGHPVSIRFSQLVVLSKR